MDTAGCYECTARAERKFALQGSGLVRTVGLCAQSRVPRAIATAREMHCRMIGADGQSSPGGILFVHELRLHVS